MVPSIPAINTKASTGAVMRQLVEKARNIAIDIVFVNSPVEFGMTGDRPC